MNPATAMPLHSADSSWSRAVLSGADFQCARELIHALAGIALNESKKVMVASRLARRLRATGFERYADYLAHVAQAGSAERGHFVNALTTNLTSFFRESYHFPVLAGHIAQRARMAKTSKAGPAATVWSAGCSTGQEPYSMAIALIEAFGDDRPPVRIIASDIDTETLAFAERGVYPLDKLAGLTSAQLRRFFLCGSGPNEGFASVRPELRRLVDFRHVNLSDAHWDVPDRLDAIFCRNVMIYFSKAMQRQVLRRFDGQLAPEGLLFAGHSENILFVAGDTFRSHGKTIYRVGGAAQP